MDRTLTDYSPQMESFETSSGASARVFNEADELALAAELMEVSDEQSLDRFLGNLVARASSAASNFIKSPRARALGLDVLKGAARGVLPVLGRAAGSYFDAPGKSDWKDRGQQLGSTLAGWIPAELEGLSPEDRDFELAKGFVRFAGQAVHNAIKLPANLPPLKAAQQAAAQAAQRYAPGLLRQPAALSSGQASSGRWFRRGHNSIVIVGA